MRIIFLLTICTKLVICKNNYQLVATALFYTDSKGKIFIVAGDLPNDTYATIHKDVASRAKIKLPIQVASVYKNVEDVPDTRKVLKILKARFNKIYAARIPKDKSQNIINDMRKSMSATSPLFLYLKQRLRTVPPAEDGDEIIPGLIAPPGDDTSKKPNKTETNNWPEPTTQKTDDTSGPTDGSSVIKEDSSTSTSQFTWHPTPIQQYWSHDKFIPNDIYYGIEKICANWNPACDLQGPNSALDLPSSYFKYPQVLRPPIVNWLP